MKKLHIICFSLILIGLQACTGDVKDDDQPITAKDTTKIAVPIDRDDAQFAVQAANSRLTEVELGKLAIKKGQDKRIKNLGAMLIKDHIKPDAKLQAIAKAKKITLPITIDSTDRKIIDDLDKNSGSAFDRAYISSIIKEHQDNVKLFKAASTQLMDADLRRYATRNLLVYKRHLDLMDVIKESVK